MSGIALLSNVTLAGPFLTPTLKKLTGQKIIVPSGHDTWRQVLLDPSLLDESADSIFLVLDGKAYLGEQGLRDKATAKERVDEALYLIKTFITTNTKTPLFVADFDIPMSIVRPYAHPSVEVFAMAAWRTGLETIGLPILDAANLAAEMGRKEFYAPSLWYAGALPYSMHGEKALAKEIASLWRAYQGARKKVLVLDLDNTLWGGVIGEDGVDGIILGRDHMGAAYRAFQWHCKELKEQGILLAVASKNNIDDALEGINTHPDMLLREQDFVAIKANWNPKPENIALLATELNLGLDSFVFVDDNPVEREAVKQALPGVLVPDFPEQPAKLDSFALSLAKEFFPVLRLTGEDKVKTQAYRAEGERVSIKKQFATLSEYLCSLNMTLTISTVAEAGVHRVAQLTQKTNQFNLTTRRYTEADIRQKINAPEWKIWLGSLEDRFGQLGQIALCMVKIEKDTACIDTFLMSCRTMGRGVENAFLATIERLLFEDGVAQVAASYIPTPKNTPVKNFWDECGYNKYDVLNNLYVKKLTNMPHSQENIINIITQL